MKVWTKVQVKSEVDVNESRFKSFLCRLIFKDSSY